MEDVKTLVEIFNRKAGYNLEPIAIGGGTYARAFKNVISYGANFPGDKDMCHQVDEFIYIDKFITSAKIYAEALFLNESIRLPAHCRIHFRKIISMKPQRYSVN